jgi:hypothetical protein
MEDWKFDAQRAAAVEAPVLSILGTRSGLFFDTVGTSSAGGGRKALTSIFPVPITC